MLLVTGITGHSGRCFLKELIDNKYEGILRCIVRENSDASLLDNSNLKIEKVFGDLNDKNFVNTSMQNIDTVIHIASIFYSTIVMEFAIKNNVKRAIFVHTTGIYSKYKSASYEYKNIEKTIKNMIEKANSSIGLIYLRPTMIVGNINDKNMIVFIKMVDKLRVIPIINNGKCLLQPVNGRDLGKAYYQVLFNKNILNGDYILSGDKPISMLDMFKLISDILNKKTVLLSVPLIIGEFMARCLKFLTLNKIDYVEKVQRMAEDRSFSHESAYKDFNYTPMAFKSGLKIEIAEYLESKNK